MDIRKFPTILAVFLVAVLIVQPVFSATTVTSDNLEKDEATVFYNNGDILVVKGDYVNAIALFDKALASNTTMIKKSDALLYLYRDKAYAQIQLEKYSDAVATVDSGLAIYPNDAMLWNNKGKALEKLGKSQDALMAYDKAVSFDQNYTLAHVNRGIILSQMGRYSEAVAAYSKANETNPFNEDILDKLEAAKKGEAESTRTMTILIVIILIAAIGIVVWYVKFRKPAEPAPEKKKKKSEKK